MEAIPFDPTELDECKQYHLEAVCDCFEHFADARLTVKPSKCYLSVRHVKYVGHILREGKRLPDPSKCSAISQWRWEDIETPKALKGLLALANCCSIYIHEYAKYAAPSMEALRGKYLYETPDPTTKG